MRSHLGEGRVNRNSRLLWKVDFTLSELTLRDNGEYFAPVQEGISVAVLPAFHSKQCEE